MASDFDTPTNTPGISHRRALSRSAAANAAANPTGSGLTTSPGPRSVAACTQRTAVERKADGTWIEIAPDGSVLRTGSADDVDEAVGAGDRLDDGGGVGRSSRRTGSRSMTPAAKPSPNPNSHNRPRATQRSPQ